MIDTCQKVVFNVDLEMQVTHSFSIFGFNRIFDLLLRCHFVALLPRAVLPRILYEVSFPQLYAQ